MTSSEGGGEGGLRRWMFGISELVSKPNGSGILDGFFGSQTLLGPNPSSQCPFFAASQHFNINVRKLSFFLPGNLFLATWIAARAQLS